jgi:hypothetical protein
MRLTNAFIFVDDKRASLNLCFKAALIKIRKVHIIYEIERLRKSKNK